MRGWMALSLYGHEFEEAPGRRWDRKFMLQSMVSQRVELTEQHH